MSNPAAVPAAAVIGGAAVGAMFPGSPTGAVLAVLLAGLAVACAAFALYRPLVLLAAVASVFFAGAWALSARATRSAVEPPLRAAMSSVVGGGPVVVEGRLRADGAAGAGGVSLEIAVERWTQDGRPASGQGGMRLTVGGALGAGQMAEWRAGRLVAVPALVREPGRYLDPGVPDARLALARKGVALVGSVKSGALVEVLGRGSRVEEATAALRHAARTAVGRHVGRLDPQSAAIVIAILIGDRAGLDPAVQRRLQEAGTYHVIAISGGNIAILAGVVIWLFRLIGAGRRAGSWLTVGVLIGYAEVVGGSASVVRATVMAVIYLVARQADHRSAPVNAVAVTCAVILLATPGAVADVAFWLTFGATLGILVGVGRASLPRARWLRAPAALLLTSVCAELALFPVAARVFSRVTCAGLALNFIAIPMMSVAQVAGMLTVALARVWPGAADVCGLAAHLGASGLVWSATLVEVVPWLSYRLPPPHWVPMAGYYGSWVGLLAARHAATRSSRAARGCRVLRRCAAAGIVVCGAWILVSPATLVAPGVSGRLRVTMLDVGHGDAVLIQLPDRRSVLVDTAGSLSGSAFDIGGRVVAPSLWSLGTRRLDLLVLTHGDPDHVGGASSVLRDFRPRAVWEGVEVPGLQTMQELRRQAAAARIPWQQVRAGTSVRLGAVNLRVLHPRPPDWERRRVRNDDSIVIDLRYGGVSVVLTGDVGRDVEAALTDAFEPAVLRVVKVPHHGSATSSSPEFVSALRPRIAILSAGITTKVSDEVLRRYEAAGATLFRTDRQGAITLETDGRTVTVTSFTGAPGVFTK